MKLRDYQQEAVKKALPLMQDGGGFGLWLEQRTGKTLTALAIADHLQPAHLWVICPKAGGAAPEVWWREIGRWMKLHSGLNETQIRVENYEQWVSKRKVLYKEAKQLRDLMIICDESHYIKARGAARSRTVRRLGRFARWRLALTGTPIAQGIQDAWSQFDFIDPSIFGKFDNTYEGDGKTIVEEGFEGRYLIRGGYKKHDIVGFRNEKEFYRKFHTHSYRKTLREAREVPLRIKYSKVEVELSKRTRVAYEELKRDLVTEVNKTKIKVKNVLASLIKLQQVTGGSVLVATEDELGKPMLVDISREKLFALSQTVRQIQNGHGGKFIVIARFRHEMDRIAVELRRAGYTVALVRGGEPYDGKFREDCIVMQIQAGIAVDMSKADTIICYSIDFSMLNFEQARFRILDFHKPVGHYYFINAKDTVDDDIYLAITRKQSVAKRICDTYRTQR